MPQLQDTANATTLAPCRPLLTQTNNLPHQLGGQAPSPTSDCAPRNVGQHRVERSGGVHVAPQLQVAEATVVVQRYVAPCVNQKRHKSARHMPALVETFEDDACLHFGGGTLDTQLCKHVVRDSGPWPMALWNSD